MVSIYIVSEKNGQSRAAPFQKKNIDKINKESPFSQTCFKIIIPHRKLHVLADEEHSLDYVAIHRAISHFGYLSVRQRRRKSFHEASTRRRIRRRTGRRTVEAILLEKSEKRRQSADHTYVVPRVGIVGQSLNNSNLKIYELCTK